MAATRPARVAGKTRRRHRLCARDPQVDADQVRANTTARAEHAASSRLIPATQYEEVGADVSTSKPGQFVVGGFLATDDTCPLCRAAAHANCQQVTGYDGCQTELIRIPHADGTERRG
jgi:hypothetical protein